MTCDASMAALVTLGVVAAGFENRPHVASDAAHISHRPAAHAFAL